MCIRLSLGLALGFAVALPARVVAECDWLPGQPMAGVDGIVYALAVWDDGSGPSLYAGGVFTVAGNAVANHIAKWNGTKWAALGAGMAGPEPYVLSLTVYNGQLIAGGWFTSAGGVSANNIARWDGKTWAALGSGTGGSKPWVSALTVYNGELIAGGQFTSAGGVSAKRIARWNGTAWSALGETGTGMDGSFARVSSLGTYNGELIAGGDFNSVAGVSANHVARWDGATWASLGTGTSGDVFALTVYNGYLIAGGDFSRAGDVEARSIAHWNGTAWAPLGAGISGRLYDLTVYNGELIAAGDFYEGGGLNANLIARWNGITWAVLGDGLACHPGYPGALALAVYNGELFAGGGLTAAGGVAVNGIARWSGATWARLGTGMDGVIMAMTMYDGGLVAGGNFTTAGDVSANYVARLDGTTWAPLGGGMDNVVGALTTYDGDLIAGGWFTTAGGVSANRIARWNGTSWTSLGTGMGGTSPYPYVSALASYNGNLIAGGNFTSAGGATAMSIAHWDGTAWAPLGSGMGGDYPSFHPVVYALAVYKGELIAGGYFKTAGDASAMHIARWDGTTWAPLGSGMGSSVRALAVYNGDLIAGGYFRTAGEVSAWYVARWNGTSWRFLGAGMVAEDPNLVQTVYALAAYNGELIAGGNFEYADGVRVNNIARWNETSWSPLGEAGIGMSGTVSALTLHSGELMAGGTFTTAGGNVSAFWARWGATGVRGDADGDGHLTLADLTDFTNCVSDPVTPGWSATTDPDCLCVHNTDGDGDVDLLDFAAFQRAFGG